MNGKEVSRNDKWEMPEVVDVTKEIRAGENLMAARAQNDSSFAGFIGKLEITFSDKTTQTVVTDNSWLSSDKEASGWEKNGLATRGMQRHERVVEHEITHTPAQGDAFRLVEYPVDAEVNSALAVLFLSLGEGRETPWSHRAHVPVVVPRDSVQLVRHEGKSDCVGAVESAQRLEQGAPESGVA